MNIKHKIKLVEVLRLRPADLEFLNSVPLSEECLAALMNENCELLEKELDGIINKDDLDEKTRLVAASLKTHLQWTSTSDAIDEVCAKMVDDDFDDFDGFSVEDTWENRMYKEKQGNPKEREKAFKEGKN